MSWLQQHYNHVHVYTKQCMCPSWLRIVLDCKSRMLPAEHVMTHSLLVLDKHMWGPGSHILTSWQSVLQSAL